MREARQERGAEFLELLADNLAAACQTLNPYVLARQA